MSAARDWLVALGFRVVHTPGIARAWRCDFPDGGWLLVTDVGGFDLPEPGGPYAALCLSPHDELLAFVPWLPRAHDLYRWIRRRQRLVRNPN